MILYSLFFNYIMPVNHSGTFRMKIFCGRISLLVDMQRDFLRWLKGQKTDFPAVRQIST